LLSKAIIFGTIENHRLTTNMKFEFSERYLLPDGRII
jgi:hypothetical protein